MTDQANRALSPEEIKPLGAIFINMGIMDANAVDAALRRAAAKRERFGELVVNEGLVTEVELAQALANQRGVDYLALTGFTPDATAVKMLPEKVVRRFLILPIEIRDQRLTLAVYNPIDVEMLDLVGRMLNMPIDIKISPKQQLIDAIDGVFKNRPMDLNVARAPVPPRPSASVGDSSNLRRVAPAAPAEGGSIERLVNKIMERGIAETASDIHIDPAAEDSRVRMRIDGVLHEISRFPQDIHGQVLSRLKVLSGLDIAEKRNAQDGRFAYTAPNVEVDVRISTVPTIRGEKAVMRLLNKRKKSLSLEEVGMDPVLAEKIAILSERPFGVFFVTGPTGSGKTTSLYSMLARMNSVDRNIVTVEDPVEFTFDIINQIQVNERAGITFPTILRSLLRQDPDVMMIGEVRDTETAQIAIQSALTGHLVLSTLHTNGAVSAIPRLLDMKIEPFLLSSSLLAVLAQRLVRKLCTDCKKPNVATEKDSALMGEALLPPGTRIFTPVGCPKCHNSGYKGRVPVFELMEMDETLRTAINVRASETEIMAHLRSVGFRTLREDGARQVWEGNTSVDEVIKATVS
jgi:type IV pilus assembly protein PilB